MASWVSKNRKEALEYVVTMPKGQVRDTSLRSYLMADRDNEDYAEQLDLAVTIENEKDRGIIYDHLMGRYLRSSEAAARAYLAKDPDLTQEQQDEIISRAIKKAGTGR